MQQFLTLGERIVLAARMAADRHLQSSSASDEQTSAARRQHETGGAGPQWVTDDQSSTPSTGARVAELRTRAPRAGAD